MSYLAIDLAIWERLVGAPLDDKGRPVVDENNVPVNRLVPGWINTEPNEAEEAAGIVGPPPRPSYGVRIPMMLSSQAQHRMSYSLPNTSMNAQRPPRVTTDFAPHNYLHVPVYPQNIEGIDLAQVWPAVTFYWMDTYIVPELSPYGDYGYYPAVNAADVALNIPGEEPIVGKDRLVYIPTGDAFTSVMAIRVYSKYDHEIKLICDCIHRIFPTRTSLFVERADGSTVAFAMSLVGVDNLDRFNINIPKTIHRDREFSRAFVYEVSGTIDNTMMLNDGGFGQTVGQEDNVILERWLEMQRMTAEAVQRTVVYGTERKYG